MQKKNSGGIPYLDSAKMILLTVAINLAMAFLFMFGRALSQMDVLVDAAICAVVSSVVSVVLARTSVRGLRAKGALTPQPPSSRFMQRLPRNPWLLAAMVAVASAAIMLALTYVVMSFFRIETYTFARFLVWKLVYSFILSAKLIEFCVLRYVQLDCVKPSDPPQRGEQAIKNPLPRMEMFSNLFNTVTTDFGFNMLAGLLLGGTRIVDYNVVIAPTHREGILISGAVLGLIVSFRMVMPVAKSIRAMRDGGGLPPAPKRNPLIAWLPETPWRFALTLAPLIVILSAAVFWAVFTFFDFEVLHFFQYFVVRTIYTSLLSKPVVLLAVIRYMQPAKAAKAAKAAV